VLKDDLELSRADIQLLSNSDALAAFFAKLGYNTNDRLAQNVAAMGFSSDSLKSAITHIERLASQDARLFEIYLFELKSVTVATTQGIVRNFRNRPGDYLLVLTDDYVRLDFVLVERYTSELSRSQPQETFTPGQSASRQVGVRPRVLTANRRNPDDVALRILRRFSYTEGDTFAQYDKLLSAYDVADWSEPFFNNRALFSDYYLTARLPNSTEWKSTEEAVAMTRAFKTLRELYADVRETFSNQPEEVIRARLLEPVFTTLGFVAQPVKTKNNNSIQPDYKLYASTTALAKPLALCLVYTWGRNLDGKDEQRDSQAPEENPGAVVVTLLDSGEADWAIVTNGKTWRLYSAKAHSRATNYYEIDLEETLAQLPANREYAFRYFWLFFRAAAFIPTDSAVDGEKRQMCFLDSLLNESERYARELGERLKERVFFEIFPHFARGFIIYARRTGQLPANLDSLDAGERDRLLEPFFSGTLTFLYRLLFLLYAESRDLLPVREVRGYYEKSLEKLKKQVAGKAGTIQDQAPDKLKAAYNDLSTTFYDRLQELFNAVDKGDAALNVPVYNGGLFMTQPDPADTSPEADVARFLSTCKIPDRELATGLDLMARDRDEKRHDLAFIDYKSLGVRQLGSIYEGLLEFKLRIAPIEMAVIKGKKTEETVSYTEAQQKKLTILKEGRGKDAREKVLPKGTVYLENDRRERKATGSYYTPDYIVKYIVEHTVGPVIAEKLETLRPIFREAEKTLKAERGKVNALGRKDISPENETYKKFRTTLNEVFFDLKVLDPAMGSGHFLVEAVDYITDQMAKILTAFRWNPIVHELAQTRHGIQEEMERQGVTIDMSKLTDLNLLKRRVLKSCIYGVDLNPMAVELAKVSLWLDCFTLGAPLSFLDHHMKCGNSLIGGNVQEVQDALSRDLFGHQFTDLLNATQLMRKVGELSDVTSQEVAESREAYKGAYDALAPFKRLLDVWISEYFGNKKAQITTSLYAGAIVADNYSKTNIEDKQAIEIALALAKDKRFFHWELEFPEVFFDETERKDSGGFDAVVGNPPYRVLIKSQVGDDLLRYYNQIYKAAQYNPNLFALMIERAISISKFDACLSLIIPSLWLTNTYFSQLRQIMANSCQILELIDLGFGVFEEVVETSIFVNKKSSTRSIYETFLATKASTSEQINDLPFTISSEKILEKAETGFDFFGQGSGFKTKLGRKTETLAKSFIVYRGVETRNNEKYLASSKISPDYRPILMGTSVDRYTCEWTGTYVKFIPRELKSNADITMYDVPEKVLLRRTGSYLLAGLDTQRLLAIKNLYVLIPISERGLSAKFLLALLNSKLLDTYNQAVLGNAGDAFAQLKKTDIEDFPIRFTNFILSPEQRIHYLEKARNLYEYCLSKNDQDCVLGFVDHHLSNDPEESDVVHDLLAFLAEEMIRLNKEKRAAQKEFLDWLVTTLRILHDRVGRKGIDVLTGRSKLADYPGDYQKGESPLAFEELLDILRKNKGRFGVSLSDTGLVERLRNEFEGSLERVLPLKDRLAKTDALIDQVVYQLYGLTEEEIGVVEGRV
jgi:Eco57I restriction-modification methylase/TaqI-like C-terminal specificity domain